jgi:hypothetical protein
MISSINFFGMPAINFQNVGVMWLLMWALHANYAASINVDTSASIPPHVEAAGN